MRPSRIWTNRRRERATGAAGAAGKTEAWNKDAGREDDFACIFVRGKLVRKKDNRIIRVGGVMMELWDVYDADRNKTDRTMERGRNADSAEAAL